MEGFPFSATNHQVLGHIDELFPFLYLTSEKINAIEAKFTKIKPKDAYWEFWCIPEQMLPNILEISPSMVDFLQRVYRIRDEGENIWKINALDIMTTLALFMQGTWRERLTYLFRWYNVSRTNLLEEEEHFLLIRGVARCLRKLRLIGYLDVTDADAHQIALEARIIYDEENIPHLRPGLILDHLVDWLMQSKFCKILLDFYAILQRLVDMMKTLDARSSSLLSIMQQKIEAKHVDLPTILFHQSKASERGKKLVVTHISNDRTSFLLSSSDLLQASTTSSIGSTQFPDTLYAIVERRVYVDSEHYKIETPIIKRKQVLDDLRHAPNIHCCRKYFVESNMRILHRNFSNIFSSLCTSSKSRTLNCLPDSNAFSYNTYLQLRGTDINQGIQRYELDALLPDTEYDITLYSRERQWGKIELKTSHAPTIGLMDEHLKGKELHFCILPSTIQRSLSLQKHLDSLLGCDYCNMNGRSTVIMTGSLMSSADIFQRYLFPLLESHRICPRDLEMSDISAMLQYICSSLAQQWKNNGYDSIASIFQMMQIPMVGLGDVPLLHLSGNHQLLSFNGDGPLSSSHYCLHPGKRALKRGFWRRWLYQLASQVHPKLASFVIDEVESLYNQRIASQIAPVSGIVSPVPNVTLFMMAHPQAVYYDPVTHCSLTKCAQMIQERHIYDELSHKKEPFHHYVLLIRDPSDLLLDSEPTNSKYENLNIQDHYEGKVPLHESASSENMDFVHSAQSTRQSRLFGKYELVHGEYNEPTNATQLDTSENENEDKHKLSSEPQRKLFQNDTRQFHVHGVHHHHTLDNLTEFLQIALEYQRSHPQRSLENDSDTLASAAVTIVCCNWVGGKNMKIVYRPPPKLEHLPQQNFSAPGYESREEKQVENTGNEEVVVLKILNLSACESFTEPVDLFYRNQFALFANHPLLQRTATEYSHLEGSNVDGTQPIDWYVRLHEAWESRLPPNCTLEFDDDTDTRVFHLHNQYFASSAKLDEVSLSVDVNGLQDDGNSLAVERPTIVTEYLQSCPRCWKEDEVEEDEEDSDVIAKFWQGSFGWDSSWVIDKEELFAWAVNGTSEAVETPAATSLRASKQGPFVNRVSGTTGKDSLAEHSKFTKASVAIDSYSSSLVSHRKSDSKKRKSSTEKVILPLIELYSSWDIPSFVLSHGYTTLPRRTNNAIINGTNHFNFRMIPNHLCIPFQQITMYRPVYPSVLVGIEVRRFHAYEVDETSMSVSIQAIGWGRLQCGIVSLPSNIQYQDALHLLHISPKTMMQRVHKKKLQARWIHHLASAENAPPISYRFRDLQPGTKYAVFLWYSTLQSVNITGHQVGIPGEVSNTKIAASQSRDFRSIRDVVLMVTLPPRKSQPLPTLSFMFAPFTAKDFGESFFVDYESPRIRMLHHLVNQFRFSYSSVQAVSVSPEEPAVRNGHILFSQQCLGAQLLEPTWREFGINNNFTQVPITSARSFDNLDDMHIPTSFSSNKASTHTSGDQYLPIPGRSIGNGLFVQFYGPFCVLKMKNDTVACLAEASKFLLSPELNYMQHASPANPLLGYPEEPIRVLIVITSRTFVHCFRVKTTDYAGRGMHSQQAEHGNVEEQQISAAFVRALCDWQSDRTGRDVRLLTAGHVPDMLCIHLYRSNIIPIQKIQDETGPEGENDPSIVGSMKNEAQQSHTFLSQPNTAERHLKLDPFVIIMYVFPTNLPPLPDDEGNNGDMDEDDNFSVTSSVVAEDMSPSGVSETPAATTITPGLESNVEVPATEASSNKGNNIDSNFDASTNVPLSINNNSFPGGENTDASKSNVGTEITHPPPPEIVSPSKSLASKKTFISMSVLTTTSSYNDGPTTSVNSATVSIASPSLKRASVDDMCSLGSGSVSTRPFSKKTSERSRKEKCNEMLPYWIFPSFGQPHLLSDDIYYFVEIFTEAKSSKHFKPSNYQQQQQQLLRQLHETQPSTAVSSGDSIVSMSTTSLSLAGAGSDASILASMASKFENYCSYHPAQHAWYMTPNNANFSSDIHAQVIHKASDLFNKLPTPQCVPYESLPVFHMLDFVLPILPEQPMASTQKIDKPSNTYRTYPLTLRGTKKDTIFVGSGGAGSTYLHHNSRVFNYPPKTRYLPPPQSCSQDQESLMSELTVRKPNFVSLLNDQNDTKKNSSNNTAFIATAKIPKPKLFPQGSATSGMSFLSGSNSGSIGLPPRCWMFAHQVATSMDLLRVVIGPLVGQVTKESVRILFEFNMNISLPAAYRPKTELDPLNTNNIGIITRSVRCRLRYTIPTIKPSNDDADSTEVKKMLKKMKTASSQMGQGYVDVWSDSIVAFQPALFVFRDLYPNVRYEILLPDLFPNRVLGTVQTLPLQCSSVELIFTADNCLVQVPAVEDLLNELRVIDPQTALPDIHHILDTNKYLYNFRSEDVMEFATFQQPFVYLPSDTKVIPGVTTPPGTDVPIPQPSMWHFLTEAVEAAATGHGIKSVFHLAALSPIAELENNLWSRFATHLYARSDAVLQSMTTRGNESLELLQQFQLEALEHLVRDSFRVVLSTPAVAAAFASCGHMLLHHPKYLLPVQNHINQAMEKEQWSQEKTANENKYTVQDRDRIIRRMFDHQVQLYVHSLFDGNMEQADINKGVVGKTTKDVFRDWRQSGVVVAMVDIISYRLKTRVKDTAAGRRSSYAVKEEESKADKVVLPGEEDELEIKQVKDDQAEEDEGRSAYSRASRGSTGGGEEDDATSLGSNNPRSGFSLGFLDRKQWQRLRIYAGDNTILHLIMVFPQPLITLQAVRDANEAVSEAEASLLHTEDNDEMIPWLPTNEDLSKFFRFWFDWMGKVKQESQGDEIKSILIVSSAKVPYSTLIQDMRTGFKIYQLCVGEYDLHTLSTGMTETEIQSLAAGKLGIQQQEIVMSGKIGSGYHYVHQFQGQDCYRTEPSGLISAATNSTKSSQAQTKYDEQVDVAGGKKEEPQAEKQPQDNKISSKKKEKKSSTKKKKIKGKNNDSATEDETEDEENQTKNKLPLAQLIPYQRGGTGNVGFAKVKLYLDHWSPIALWSNTNLTDLYNKAHNIGDATLLMGPLIGAPMVKRFIKNTMRPMRSKRHFQEANEDINVAIDDNDEDYGESVRVIEESRKHLSTTKPLDQHELPLYVPMMLELDRIATIRIDVRGTFTHHHLILEHTVPVAERPFVMEIGPLHRHDRYRVRFTSGIKQVSLGLNTSCTGGHPKEFVLNTHYHRDESNFILLNMARPGDTVSPAAVHLSDLRRRSNVAFHGLHNLILTHFEPDVTDTLRTLQQSPLLKQGVEEFQEMLNLFAYQDLQTSIPMPIPGKQQSYGPIIPTLFRKEISRVLSTLRERYRENFCSPSLKDLLRMNMNLLMPKLRYDILHMHHVHHQGLDVNNNSSYYSAYSAVKNMANNVNGSNNNGTNVMVNGETLEASMERLLHLLDAFVAQEYIDHFRFYDVNVYRVLLPTYIGSNKSKSKNQGATLYGMWQEDGVEVEREDVFAEYVTRDLEIWHEQQMKSNNDNTNDNNSSTLRYKLLWMHDSIGHAPVPRTSLSSPPVPLSANANNQQEEQEYESRPNSPAVDETCHPSSHPSKHIHSSKGMRIRQFDSTNSNLSNEKMQMKPDTLEALVVAWLAGCVPAPTVFVPYHALNRKASVERMRSLDTKDKVLIATRSFIRDTSVHKYNPYDDNIDSSNDDKVYEDELQLPSLATPSVRLLVLADDDLLGTETTLMSLEPSPSINDSLGPLFQRIQEWQDTFATHRIYHLFVPCVGHGTVQRNASFSYVPPNNRMNNTEKRSQMVSIVLLDSIFRSNEYDRRHQIAELEKKMFKKQLTAAAAKSKRAQQKKEEEERSQRQQIRQQVLDIVAQQKPDGYVFVHCHTTVMYSPIEQTTTESTGGKDASEEDIAVPTITTVPNDRKSDDNNNDDKNTSTSNSNKPKGMVIIDTMGGTASTAAPVPAITNLPAKEDRLMLMDNHDAKPETQEGEHDTGTGKNKKPQQRDELTIVDIDICGDLLPLQLQYEADLEEKLQVAKNKIDPLTGEPQELPLELQYPMSSKEYIADVLHKRRYNFLQYPPWFVTYFPAHVTQATFVVDEVFLLLRQLPKTQALLVAIESDSSLYQKFVHRYEWSRLSELSRPEDLREVDMSSPEVVAVFFYDIIRAIWQEDIPREMKSVMLSLQDPFVVGYIASRAFHFPANATLLPNNNAGNNNNNRNANSEVIVETLKNSGSFAQAMRRVCVYAMAMKMARDMSSMRRYQYIVEQATDPAWEKIQALEITERMIDNATRRRHAERNAEKQFMNMIRKINDSLAKKSQLKNAKSSANTSSKSAKFSGKSISATATAPVSQGTMSQGDTNIDMKNMDVAALAEKLQEEDTQDEVLAAQIAEITHLRAETVDYESDIEELIKEAERHERGSDQEREDHEDQEDEEGAKIVTKPSKVSSKAQKTATADVDAMIAEEAAERQKKKKRPLTPNRRIKPGNRGGDDDDDDDDDDDNVVLVDETGHLDETAMAQLQLQRGQWEQESMDMSIDRILESLLAESVESFQELYLQELICANLLPVTREERSNWAAVRMKRLAEEHRVFRRIYGQRANPLGI